MSKTYDSGRERRGSDLRHLIRTRRTIYDFKPEEPDLESLKDAMRLACWAPNHRHTHPWRFYLLSDHAAADITARYRELVLEKRGEETARIKSARWDRTPTWFVITSQRSEDPQTDLEDYGACCCMVQNLALLLWEGGIGLKWSTGAVTQDPLFLKRTGIDPSKERVVGLFGCGYPAEIPDVKLGRRDEYIALVD